MQRAILVVLMLLAESPALAVDVDTRGLTEQQIAEMQATVARAKADNVKNKVETTKSQAESVLSPDSLSQYATLGRDIGVGLASTAREIGVAANDFAHTSVGRIAMLLIIYKLIGRDLVHYVGGMIWFLTMIPLWVILFRKMYLYKAITTNYDPQTGKRVSVVRLPLDVSNEYVMGGRFIMAIILCGLCGIGFIITFSGN